MYDDLSLIAEWAPHEPVLKYKLNVESPFILWREYGWGQLLYENSKVHKNSGQFFSAKLKIWRDLAPADKKMWSRLGENLNEKNLNEWTHFVCE